jgi:uncharacterized protein (DUF342 family)
MNSSVHTLDRIEMGYKGVIIGGKIHAQNGVTATQIGSQSGTTTEIYCGVDYSVEQKLEWIRDKNIELAMKLKRVEERIKGFPSEAGKLGEVRDKIKVAIQNLSEAAGTLITQLDKNEDAKVAVRGDVFPGVYIEICHCSYIVSCKLRGVSFKLDKDKGKIVADPLGQATVPDRASMRK